MIIQENAPVKQSAQRFIAATPEKVWTVLTDINRWPEWQTTIARAEMHGPAVVGASFDWKVNGMPIKSTLAWVEKASGFGWTGKTFGATAVHIFKLKTVEGGTLVEVAESMDGWVMRLFSKKMNAALGKDMEGWLEMLEREVKK